MENTRLLQLVKTSCRKLLSEQDRDPYSSTFGCFDRRYWGWKLVDFPEATFQRNVYPLAWLLRNDASLPTKMKGVLNYSIQAGLQYAVRIQHSDGSFDQAFPNEHSFGATAFLLHPMLAAFEMAHDAIPENPKELMESCFRRAADFLRHHEETHGFISNHLAGAALSLFCAADFFHEPGYEKRANELLNSILVHQSEEGWFLEYNGADPGYQTLCMYYLAQIYMRRPFPELHTALQTSINFLSWFIHPDATFGGEYGARRTAIYYPGGVAVLCREFSLARSMTEFMLSAIFDDQTISTEDIDMGNLAPLLSNYILTLDADLEFDAFPSSLPCQQENSVQDFPEAGLFIRGGSRYYSVLSVANGGVLKVFDRSNRSLVWNDGGYVGVLGNSAMITTQITDLSRKYKALQNRVELETPFYRMPRSLPTPFQFIILRILNLTVMRNVILGNILKGFLVNLLMRSKISVPLFLRREVVFDTEKVIVRDVLTLSRPMDLRWLAYGRAFVGIHMASARYFENADTASGTLNGRDIPVNELHADGSYTIEVIL